jgi:3-phosphoshikimate 1-carboxyvinyltransferase
VKRELNPARIAGGTIVVPGDKSIAHRAALLSVLARESLSVRNFPDNADCQRSLGAAQALGVHVRYEADGSLVLIPPAEPYATVDTIIDCGNSGTTARLLAGLVSGTQLSVILSGDESLSRRPMQRIVEPLSAMGAELFDTDGHLPLKVAGRQLLPFEYRLPLPSAQVKSAILLAGIASGCSIQLREDAITRDHTELMIAELGGEISVREIKPMLVEDPIDPRKKKRVVTEDFKKEILLGSKCAPHGGCIDIPGDFSTAAFFMVVGAISGHPVKIENVGLNPTRTTFLDHLKAVGCSVSVENRTVVSGEARGTITVSGGALKARKVSGDLTVQMIDEIPAIAILAAFAEGTSVIRDATELRFKESDRIAALAANLERMGVSCGVLEDGLVIEGRQELSGADFRTLGDHRIAMAFSVASLFAVGPSSIDNADVVNVSCPGFYELLNRLAAGS